MSAVERLDQPVNPVQAAMPKGFVDVYTRAISSLVPPDIMSQAQGIVAAHRPEGLPEGFEPLCMAKVLVAEDDPDWMKIYTDWAKRFGHTTVTASSAEEAKRILEQNGVDLIITDGLKDTWSGIHDSAQSKGTRTVVVSGSYSVQKEAKRRGVEFIDKVDDDLSDKVKGILKGT